MTPDQNNMRLYLLGQRFVDPQTEVAYREWRKVEAFPVMWLGAIVATLSWAGIIPSYYLFAPSYFDSLSVLLYLSLLLFGLGTTLGLSQKVRPHMIWVVAAMNLYGGTALIFGNYFIGDSLGGALSASMLIMLYAPFMRLPVLTVIMACGPYWLLGNGLVIYEIQQGNLGEWEAFSYLLIPAVGFLTVLLVCAVTEAFFRRSYTRECLIASQSTELENAARQIRRYVPAAVAEQILGGQGDAVDEPQRRKVSILFSDIVGFTDMADRLDPEDITEIVNQYMAAMSDIVDVHQGTVTDFIGDGLMAMFGAPLELSKEEQATQAVRAAQAMQQKLPALNANWRKLGLGEDLEIRIGINTGMASVGSFGSEGRMSYTAIGLQVNVAARIQSHCEPGGVLVSDSTYQLVKDEIDCEPRGEVDCKGVHYPVKVYAPK